MPRRVFHLVYFDGDCQWHVNTEGGTSIGCFGSKDEAFEAGHHRCQALGRYGKDAQLIVHRQDGSIEDELFYRRDHS